MDRAIQIYHDALVVFEWDADVVNGYAWWVFENKVKTEYETAIRRVKMALEWRPEAPYIWDTLAWQLTPPSPACAPGRSAGRRSSAPCTPVAP